MRNSINASRYPVVALLCLSLSILPAHAIARADDEAAAVRPQELKHQNIPVDERIFLERWNEVPFDKHYFTYTDEQIKEQWPRLTRSLRVPYPSPRFLARQFAKYPWLAEEIDGFDGDYEALHRRYLQVGRLFLAGDFQAAREQGLKLGAIGKGLAMISQIVYATYLADDQAVKEMMLQDVMNTAEQYLPKLEPMEADPEVAPYVALVRLGYTYAMGRIAEESAVPVVVARNYIPRIKNNAEDIIEMVPNHPLAHAFRAGVDANIMRRVGKFTGRMTYRARTTTVEESFSRALELVPDMALILYERANAELYVNRRRNINNALSLLEQAVRIQPLFAMEALDSMYAFKRLKEIRLYAQSYRSFRKFDKARRKFVRKTNRNLTNVMQPALTRDMLENPESHVLADSLH